MFSKRGETLSMSCIEQVLLLLDVIQFVQHSLFPIVSVFIVDKFVLNGCEQVHAYDPSSFM